MWGYELGIFTGPFFSEIKSLVMVALNNKVWSLQGAEVHRKIHDILSEEYVVRLLRPVAFSPKRRADSGHASFPASRL